MSRFTKESERLRKIALVKISERKVGKKSVGKKSVGKISTNHKISDMINSYFDLLDEYYHRPRRLYTITSDGVKKSHKGYKYYLKAIKLAEKRELDYKTYLSSQFYWFDKWFNRAPRSYEICGGGGTFPAALRVEKYLDLFLNKDNPTIKSVAIPADVLDFESLNKINSKTLQSLKQVWRMSEDEIYLNFAVGIESAFNFIWLKTRPAYQRLIEEGLA